MNFALTSLVVILGVIYSKIKEKYNRKAIHKEFGKEPINKLMEIISPLKPVYKSLFTLKILNFPILLIKFFLSD